jgi:hypothetical protein
MWWFRGRKLLEKGYGQGDQVRDLGLPNVALVWFFLLFLTCSSATSVKTTPSPWYVVGTKLFVVDPYMSRFGREIFRGEQSPLDFEGRNRSPSEYSRIGGRESINCKVKSTTYL